MNLILFDTNIVSFYPLTLTRPIAELRVGAFTISEKWNKLAKDFKVSYKTHDSLQEKFPFTVENDNIIVLSQLMPDKNLANKVSNLINNQALRWQDKIIAVRLGAEKLTHKPEVKNLEDYLDDDFDILEYERPCDFLEQLTDLFTKAELFIRRDLKLIKGKYNNQLDDHCTLIGKDLMVHKTAEVLASIINTETGPVIIEKGALVMGGCMLRGPLYIAEGAVIKMGAKIYGPTVVGPYCKVGGEIGNSVFFGYSNKGHDGYLGNSIIGEWCNLGADTNTSNLKNNYGEVKRWDYVSNSLQPSGLQFCGLIMGDHSKCAINTQFNTGTTVGVFANIFKSGFPDKMVKSFTWLGDDVEEKFNLEKACEVALRVMERRKIPLSEADQRIFEFLHNNPK